MVLWYSVLPDFLCSWYWVSKDHSSPKSNDNETFRLWCVISSAEVGFSGGFVLGFAGARSKGIQHKSPNKLSGLLKPPARRPFVLVNNFISLPWEWFRRLLLHKLEGFIRRARAFSKKNGYSYVVSLRIIRSEESRFWGFALVLYIFFLSWACIPCRSNLIRSSSFIKRSISVFNSLKSSLTRELLQLFTTICYCQDIFMIILMLKKKISEYT